MQPELDLYETPLLVDVEEACGELAACAVCTTGGGSDKADTAMA